MTTIASFRKTGTAVHSLRVLTLNVHKGFTFFNRRFILPELREAVRASEADIVFLQEVHGTHKHHAKRYTNWPAMPQYEFLADSIWAEFSYGRNAVYPAGDHGNALLSKYPIIRHQNLDVSVGRHEERGLLHSELSLPNQRNLHAICVHLGLLESHRQEQLALLGTLLDSLPQDSPVIVAGDFNDWRQRAHGPLEAHRMLEAFVQEYGAPAKSFPARWPLLRVDRIYVRNATTHNPQALSRKPWSHLSDHAALTVEVRL